MILYGDNNMYLWEGKHCTIYTYTRATVVAVDDIARRTSAGPSIRRGMATMFTAQRGTFPDTWWMGTKNVNNYGKNQYLSKNGLKRIHFKTNCNCGQLCCWFHPPHRDIELSRHKADAEGYTGRRTDRAIPLGSTPLERYLQATHTSSGSGYWESYLLTYAFLKKMKQIYFSDITVTLNRCGGWKGHMEGLRKPQQPVL